ncbi:MAG: ABC transporter permease subunit [Pirellulaceae bacterium]|nr:ABC transporter permease subunit [Pirellulaceae bacterium]
MTTYFIRRLLLTIPTFIGVTLIVFMITRIVPGGPLERRIMEFRMASVSQGGGGTTIVDSTSMIPETALDELKKTFNLDKPAYIAYAIWLKNVFQLDLGQSFFYKEPVWKMITSRFPISMTFGLTGFVLAYLVCIPLGIYKALKHGSPFDFVSSAIVFIGYSIPGWAMGVLLLLFFASGRFLDVMPLGGVHGMGYDELPRMVQAMEDRDEVSDEFGSFQWERLSPLSKAIDTGYHMVLPVFCYMLGGFATLTVLMKNALMENLGQDYVRTGFAKGLTERRVVFVHTLRNSLIPLATGLGHALSLIMAGSYLIEFVFNIDGLGYLGFNAIVQRDYAVVMGILVINTLLTLFGNIFSDVLYAVIDPRIRFD